MNRTRIKICGVTRAEDARVAAALGADFVGMVLFGESPRTIDLARAHQIVAALPATTTPVGLFVDASVGFIMETCGSLGLSIAQLHGGESPEDVAALRPLRVWKAIQVDGSFATKLSIWSYARTALSLDHLDGIVLDAAAPVHAGGSGRPNDWTAVRHGQQSSRLSQLPALIAAGGLTPETVGEIVRNIRPWAIDVSSGVEGSKKGIKSKKKIKAFVQAVRRQTKQADQFRGGVNGPAWLDRPARGMDAESPAAPAPCAASAPRAS